MGVDYTVEIVWGVPLETEVYERLCDSEGYDDLRDDGWLDVCNSWSDTEPYFGVVLETMDDHTTYSFGDWSVTPAQHQELVDKMAEHDIPGEPRMMIANKVW